MKKLIAFTLILFALTSYAATSDTQKKLLDIQNWQTANGAKVLFVHIPELPIVDISIIFAAGSARDGSRFGIANFTNSMLDEGSVNFTADDIAEGFEKVGAIFGA